MTITIINTLLMTEICIKQTLYIFERDMLREFSSRNDHRTQTNLLFWPDCCTIGKFNFRSTRGYYCVGHHLSPGCQADPDGHAAGDQPHRGAHLGVGPMRPPELERQFRSKTGISQMPDPVLRIAVLIIFLTVAALAAMFFQGMH